MNDTIIEYLMQYKELAPYIIGVMLIPKLMQFIRENHSFLAGKLRTDYNKKIDFLKTNKNNLNENNELLRSIMEYQIDNYIFINTTGFFLSKEKQADFLKFYDLVKSELLLKDFKFIYENSKIEDGLIHIKTKITTKIEIYTLIVSACLLIFVSVSLFLISFNIPKDKSFSAILGAFLCIIILLIGVIILSDAMRRKKLIKEIKAKYNNFKLY